MMRFGALLFLLALSHSFAFYFAPMPSAPKSSLRAPLPRGVVSTTPKWQRQAGVRGATQDATETKTKQLKVRKKKTLTAQLYVFNTSTPLSPGWNRRSRRRWY